MHFKVKNLTNWIDFVESFDRNLLQQPGSDWGDGHQGFSYYINDEDSQYVPTDPEFKPEMVSWNFGSLFWYYFMPAGLHPFISRKSHGKSLLMDPPVGYPDIYTIHDYLFISREVNDIPHSIFGDQYKTLIRAAKQWKDPMSIHVISNNFNDTNACVDIILDYWKSVLKKWEIKYDGR